MARSKATEAMTIPYDFEGVEVSSSTAVVRKTGDGLSEEMHFSPFVVHKDEKRFLVLEVECTDIAHPWLDKKDHAKGAARKHIFDAGVGFFLDDDLIREAAERQRERISEFREAERIAKEQAKGIFQFGAEDEEE